MIFKSKDQIFSDINIKYNVCKKLFFAEELDFDPIPHDVSVLLENLIKELN